jgi:D-glycero-D-manno-heptose 1,7-bisphosphate phosphatase
MAARKGASFKNADAADTERGRMHKNRIALVLLDRDGVLCDYREDGVLNLSMLELVPGLVRALKLLKGDNFRIGVVTNQPNVADGTLSMHDLDKINGMIMERAAEAGIKPGNFVIETCVHGRDAGCDCRKPKTGLIGRVVKRFGLNPKEVNFYIVGDMMREIQTLANYYNEALKPAGISESAKTAILLTWERGRDKGHISSEFRRLAKPDYEVHSLEEAVRLICSMEKGKRIEYNE